MKGYEVPEASRTAKGTPVINFLNLNSGEKVSAVIPVKEFSQDNYLVMITRSGTIKKTPMSEFDSIRKNGLIAINLKDGDKLISVSQSNGDENIYVITKLGKAIAFNETMFEAWAEMQPAFAPSTWIMAMKSFLWSWISTEPGRCW